MRKPIVLLSVLLIVLSVAVPVAAAPPCTEITAWLTGDWVFTQYGSDRVSGAAYHVWDWVMVNTSDGTDARIRGEVILGPDIKANLGPGGEPFAMRSNFLLLPDPALGGYWEGVFVQTPGLTRYVGHGRGTFAGMQLMLEVFDDPAQPYGIGRGRIIEHP